MSMNLSMQLNGVWLDKLYQTPTDVSYWCVQESRWAKRNPRLQGKQHPPHCSTISCYHKYATWCWQRAHSWCKEHQPYISEPFAYAGYTIPERIVSRGEQNKDTYNSMRHHLAEVRKLVQAGATFIVT